MKLTEREFLLVFLMLRDKVRAARGSVVSIHRASGGRTLHRDEDLVDEYLRRSGSQYRRPLNAVLSYLERALLVYRMPGRHGYYLRRGSELWVVLEKADMDMLRKLAEYAATHSPEEFGRLVTDLALKLESQES